LDLREVEDRSRAGHTLERLAYTSGAGAAIGGEIAEEEAEVGGGLGHNGFDSATALGFGLSRHKPRQKAPTSAQS
jgi:hypothetical protein